MATPPAVTAAIKAAGRAEYAVVRDIIRAAKAGRPCADCGATKPSRSMHFHHLEPAAKTKNVMSCTTPKAARAELAKCVLLCVACHHARHRAMRAPKTPPN